MNLLPPMSPEKVQIADEALNRIPSNNGGGAYSQRRRSSVVDLKQQIVSEKETKEEGDERDLRKKQVMAIGAAVDSTVG